MGTIIWAAKKPQGPFKLARGGDSNERPHLGGPPFYNGFTRAQQRHRFCYEFRTRNPRRPRDAGPFHPTPLKTHDLAKVLPALKSSRRLSITPNGRTFMTTSISSVFQPHSASQPTPAAKAPQAPKPAAQPAAAKPDTVTLRSTQKANPDGDHG
jgi:hypothetical protein